ncbi:50S ribosomal protein L31e [Candidatus Pacearchaeota archaeon]|nr:50S ribosomal protein L31e [Candidatus Pacearchaeota archaeon]
MVENKVLEREYIIPLRRIWIRVPQYERTGKAVKAIKQFIAKHMKVTDRDVNKVKLDIFFNNDLWFKGRTNPPGKVRVKAKKEGDIVHVTFVETPQLVAFKKLREMKKHMPTKKDAPKETEEKKEEKTEEQKKDEEEKGKSVEQANIKQAEQQAKAQKHTTKVEKTQRPQRMALQK